MAKSAKSKAKEKAWNVFSRYIRRKYADDNGYVACVTCGVKKHYKEMQAGHYVDSRNNSVLFNEELVYPQCVGCNMFKHGNKIKYTKFLMDKGFTIDQLNDFDNLKFKTKKMNISDFAEIEDEYLDKLVALDIVRRESKE